MRRARTLNTKTASRLSEPFVGDRETINPNRPARVRRALTIQDQQEGTELKMNKIQARRIGTVAYACWAAKPTDTLLNSCLVTGNYPATLHNHQTRTNGGTGAHNNA